MTHQQFVAAWLGVKTLPEFTSRTGIDGGRARNAAAHMRERGVLLPKLAPSTGESLFSDALDVDALNKFITER